MSPINIPALLKGVQQADLIKWTVLAAIFVRLIIRIKREQLKELLKAMLMMGAQMDLEGACTLKMPTSHLMLRVTTLQLPIELVDRL